MKTRTDTERFARYQSVVNLLLTKDSFYKLDIYEALGGEEKAFIGRVAKIKIITLHCPTWAANES